MVNKLKYVQPDIVSMENVPQMVKEKVFANFIQILEDNDYSIDYKVVYAPEYGVLKKKTLITFSLKIRRNKLLPPQFDKIIILHLGDNC